MPYRRVETAANTLLEPYWDLDIRILEVSLFPSFRCVQYCLDNLSITRTSADVSGNAHPHFVLGGVGIFLQKGKEGHQKAAGAKAALQAMLLVEGRLQRMQLAAVGQSLDGQNVATGQEVFVNIAECVVSPDSPVDFLAKDFSEVKLTGVMKSVDGAPPAVVEAKQ